MKVLVVDDDEGDQIIIEFALNAMGIESDKCFDSSMAISKAELGDYDAVLVDYHMPIIDGCELLGMIHEKKPNLDSYLVTGMPKDHFKKTRCPYTKDIISKDGLIKNLRAVFCGV